MSQSTALTTPQKRSRSFQSQDQSQDLRKKPKSMDDEDSSMDDEDRRMLDYVYQEFKDETRDDNGIMPPTPSGVEATQRSWTYEFVGLASKALKETILYYASITPVYYGQAIPIVQSSGTGKSRMVDELARELPVIPFNLRPPNHTGFPPSDTNVRWHLSQQGSQLLVLRKCLSFLSAVFIQTKLYLENIDDILVDTPPNATLPYKFHCLMSEGVTYFKQGPLRTKFYGEVVKLANEIYNAPNANVNDRALKEAKALANFAQCQGYPAVVLSFDEVHGLFETKVEGNENVFHSLRRALSYITKEKRVVSLFLSTVSDVYKCAPPAYMDPSEHIQKSYISILPAFTETGFDQLAVGLVKKDEKTLEEMVTDEWMCNFGRPLFGTRYKLGNDAEKASIVDFAAVKLQGGGIFPPIKQELLSRATKIAIMATRLSLCFDHTSLESRGDELKQVQSHMRFCLAIRDDNETAFTIAPSEPLLAEAAFRIIDSAPETQVRLLEAVLTGPSLDKGDCGEMVALLLFLLARDAAVKAGAKRNIKLNDFLKALLQSNDQHTPGEGINCRDQFPNVLHGFPSHYRKEDDNVTLEKCFEHAEMHFNHFIRLEGAASMKSNYVHTLIARGAAIVCPVNQQGVDVVIPFVLDGSKKVGPKNVSAILCQVRNRVAATTKANGYLFDPAMDPFEYFYKDKSAPVPLIRIVMALKSRHPGVAVLPRRRQNPSQAAAPYGKDSDYDRYTAYDIWCARACSSTFKVISSDEDETYMNILLADSSSVKYSSGYGCRSLESELTMLRKSGNPGVNADDPDHSRFVVL